MQVALQTDGHIPLAEDVVGHEGTGMVFLDDEVHGDFMLMVVAIEMPSHCPITITIIHDPERISGASPINEAVMVLQLDRFDCGKRIVSRSLIWMT